MTDFDALATVDRQDLLRLADLLEAGLLTPPFSPLALRNHIPAAHADAVVQCFGELSKQDVPATHNALLLRAFAAGLQARSRFSAPIELVISGPDSTGGARDTGVVMRQLFGKARKRVLAVGFAVRQGKSVFRALADRLDNDDSFEATICIDVGRQHGDTTISRDILRHFANDFVQKEWPGNRLPRVYYDPRSLEPTSRTASSMHAKCVVIDGQEVLVTSANFTEAAQHRNIELGILVHSSSIAGQIEEHFMTLIQESFLQRIPTIRS